MESFTSSVSFILAYIQFLFYFPAQSPKKPPLKWGSKFRHSPSVFHLNCYKKVISWWNWICLLDIYMYIYHQETKIYYPRPFFVVRCVYLNFWGCVCHITTYVSLSCDLHSSQGVNIKNQLCIHTYIYIYIHYVVWSNTNLIHAYSHLFTEKAFLSSSFLFFPYCLNTTNFMPLHLSVGHNLLRRLWFLPHSGFELVLFLCDVWTFQWWSCWTLPRAESATHDKTLELFSSAKYLHSSLFHMMLLFSLLSFAANTTLCELCQ